MNLLDHRLALMFFFLLIPQTKTLDLNRLHGYTNTIVYFVSFPFTLREILIELI